MGVARVEKGGWGRGREAGKCRVHEAAELSLKVIQGLWGEGMAPQGIGVLASVGAQGRGNGAAGVGTGAAPRFCFGVTGVPSQGFPHEGEGDTDAASFFVFKNGDEQLFSF